MGRGRGRSNVNSGDGDGHKGWRYTRSDQRTAAVAFAASLTMRTVAATLSIFAGAITPKLKHRTELLGIGLAPSATPRVQALESTSGALGAPS